MASHNDEARLEQAARRLYEHWGLMDIEAGIASGQVAWFDTTEGIRELAREEARIIFDAIGPLIALKTDGERGQPGNGLSKLVFARRPGGSVVVQAQRGDVDAELVGRTGGLGSPWAVAVVNSHTEERFTPEGARKLAVYLLEAASECERFEREDADGGMDREYKR